jgi:hypothetical protein
MRLTTSHQRATISQPCPEPAVTSADVIVGTRKVADAIVHWYHEGAADGFNIMPPVLPSGLVSFVDRVVPILQRRGLFRTEYDGTTLRDNYGLPRPTNRNTPVAVAASPPAA